ncbi:MAG: ABC transporter ATP-binding protein [Nitrososphaerales archaeon]|jgi:ABC-type branched-subunit amino acid transport system ATPase component
MSLLEFRNVTAGYEKLAIVQELSVEVNQGSIFAIIGPNGSGKSTLIKTVVGEASLIEGAIRFGGRDISRMQSYAVAKLGISYVPQIQNVFTNLSVQENLEVGGATINRKATLTERIGEMYQLFPILKERMRQKAKTMSGGERQVLAISRGLVMKPNLLLLDEPTASVAPNTIAEIMRKICEIRDSGVTVVLVEQNVKQALQIADVAMVLVAGRKVVVGDSKELARNPDLPDLFLGKKTM